MVQINFTKIVRAGGAIVIRIYKSNPPIRLNNKQCREIRLKLGDQNGTCTI